LSPLLLNKPQGLFGNQLPLVDAVADTDPSIGASREEKAGQFREPTLDAGEPLLVSYDVLVHSPFPAVDSGEVSLLLENSL